jgi:hypothetical protein
MKIYSIENGYEKNMFCSFEAANDRFVEIARDIITSYKKNNNDMGYLDLNMWITVYDSQTMLADSYIMPNLSNMRRKGSPEPDIEWLHYKGPGIAKQS